MFASADRRAAHEHEELVRRRGSHRFAGDERPASVQPQLRRTARGAVALDDDDREVAARSLADAAAQLDVLLHTKAQDFERSDRVGAEVVVQHPARPPAGDVDDAATLESPPEGLRSSRQVAEPAQHVVELVTVGGQQMADRLQVAGAEHRGDGAHRAVCALTPAGSNLADPCIEHSSPNLHDRMTS